MSESLYDKNFYNQQVLGSLQSAQVYLYHLFSIWGVPESVVDLGCGRGAWLATCRDFGVTQVVGIDGDWNCQQAMLDSHIEFHSTNLERKISLNSRFDLAISLEVAEHLRPESSDTFVASLTGLSDVIMFGAAFSGQPGVNHINTRPHSFWAMKFHKLDYALIDLFRPVFWNDDRVEPCYRQNTFLYVKRGHGLHKILAERGYPPSEESLLIDSVHPAIYLGLLNEFLKLQKNEDATQVPPPFNNNSLPATAMSDQDGINRLNEQAREQAAAGQIDQAIHTCQLALTQAPNHPEGLLRLVSALMLTKRNEEAYHHIRHLIRIAPEFAYAHYLAGYIARELGKWQASRAHLLKAIELDPGDMPALVLCCMSAFTVCMDDAEVISSIGSYSTGLDALIRDTKLGTTEQIQDAVNGISVLSPFFLPYLGCDVKELQSKYGTWVCDIMAARYPHFISKLPAKPADVKVKIGIISNYFHHHSNWKVPIRGWLEQLDQSQFSLHCFHTGDICDSATESAKSASDSFFQASDMDSLITEIHDQRLDVIIYPGLGMDTNTLKLAALRLAPVQCASWGHPVTSGMPTIDYFISSDLMEPVDGHKHYTEQLIRLPNLSVWHEPPGPVKEYPENLPIAGVKPTDTLLLCSQNLMKYLPRHDHVFPEIAMKTDNCRFVFIESPVAELTGRFAARIRGIFGKYGLDSADCVSFVPPLNSADFMALNARCDIFLDCPEWSGCNTVFETLPFDKPIVTLPGTFMRGRHAYAILKMMDVTDTVATSVADYIAIASRLANDRQWRQEISDRMRRNKDRVYRDRECIHALEGFLLTVAGRKTME